MTTTAHKPGNVHTLPTPLARLYGTAMELGIEVRDYDDDGLPGADDTAAIVAFANTIALSPRLEDDGLRADVLAMALIVANVMTNVPDTGPGDIYAPGGYVIITRARVIPEPDGPGKLAGLIARKCGRDTASAAFDYYVPEFEDSGE